MNGEKEKGEGRQKRIVIGYAGVSAAKQRKELQNQKEQMQKFAKQQGWEMGKMFADIASGMNEQRKGLQKLVREGD